jgi:4-hydroxy-tetrahydrodipicolinate reductase
MTRADDVSAPRALLINRGHDCLRPVRISAWRCGEPLGVAAHGSVSDALDDIEVLIDYTSPTVVKANTLTAIDAGVAVVISTSGLTASDFAEIDQAARRRSVGVVASGNFSPTAAVCHAAALLAARHLPHWEVIDYASATKPDVPSGTARELAERLGEIRPSALGHPITELYGPKEARGATIGGAQVYSVRVPSFVVSTEVIFGLPDERLMIRHDAGGTPEPDVAGTLLAARRAPQLVGLTPGAGLTPGRRPVGTTDPPSAGSPHHARLPPGRPDVGLGRAAAPSATPTARLSRHPRSGETRVRPGMSALLGGDGIRAFRPSPGDCCIVADRRGQCLRRARCPADWAALLRLARRNSPGRAAGSATTRMCLVRTSSLLLVHVL